METFLIRFSRRRRGAGLTFLRALPGAMSLREALRERTAKPYVQVHGHGRAVEINRSTVSTVV